MDWTQIAIPKVIAEQIRVIIYPLGYASLQAFCNEGIRRHLYREKRRFDELEEERKVGRKVLGKDDDKGEL